MLPNHDIHVVVENTFALIQAPHCKDVQRLEHLFSEPRHKCRGFMPKYVRFHTCHTFSKPCQTTTSMSRLLDVQRLDFLCASPCHTLSTAIPCLHDFRSRL